MNTFQLAKDFITDQNYRLKEEDDTVITFRYQMNDFQFWVPDKGDNFFSIILSGFADMTDDNYPDVIMRCHKLNQDMKQVKLYTINDNIIIAAELYYDTKENFVFQVKLALTNLINAKIQYLKLEKEKS